MTSNSHNGHSIPATRILNPSDQGILPSARDNTGIFEPPDSLRGAETRHFLFHGSSFLLIGSIWSVVCFGMYVYASGYHVNTLYEARWMLSTLMITAFVCILFHFYRSEAVFISCWISNIYTLCACFVTAVIYGLNFHRSSTHKMNIHHRKIMTPGRQPYMVLSLCLIILSLFGLGAVIWLSFRIYRLATWHFKNISIRKHLRLNLFIISAGQWWLAVFTIYVTKQVIVLKQSIIHTYMIQELYCGLVLLALSMHQMFFLFRPNKVALKFVLFLNVCQLLQELFYAWNAYYVSLYIRSQSHRFQVGMNFDQVLMTLNFVGHMFRMAFCAYTSWALINLMPVGLRLTSSFLQVDINRGILKFVILLAASSLFLSACHVLMDILYASMDHIYRSLIAFTGISVFYASIIGISLSIFLRCRQSIFLVFGAVFAMLLVGVSIHALYIYFETSFAGILLKHLENLGRNKTVPSVLHYFEGIFALAGLILGSITAYFLLRILKMESAHESRDKIGRPLKWLWKQGLLLLLSIFLEASCLVFVKVQWKVHDTTQSYGVLDMISTFIMSLLQLYISYRHNSHISYPMIVLFFLLLAEVLTTFSYLSAYTSYIQFLIMIVRMMSPKSSPEHARRPARPLNLPKNITESLTTTVLPTTTQVSPLMDLFPISQITLVVLSHVIQLVQWGLAISSLVCTSMCLEQMQQNWVSVAARNAHIGTVSGTGEAAYINAAYDTATLDQGDVEDTAPLSRNAAEMPLTE